MLQWSFKYRDRVPLSEIRQTELKCTDVFLGLHNWLPVNMSAVVHGAECGIDLAFVVMVSNQVKALR